MGGNSKDGNNVSDLVLSALIAAVGGFLTACVPLIIEWMRQDYDFKKWKLAREAEQRQADTKPGKGKNNGKAAQTSKQNPPAPPPAPPKRTINWQRIGIVWLVATPILFLGLLIYAWAFMPGPAPTSTVSLSTATVEFRITANNIQITVPAGKTLDTLPSNSAVNIEVQVKDTNGVPYPNPLTITYYFGSGTSLTADSAPYLVKSSDKISVQIEDQVTGEVITRFMRVSAN